MSISGPGASAFTVTAQPLTSINTGSTSSFTSVPCSELLYLSFAVAMFLICFLCLGVVASPLIVTCSEQRSVQADHYRLDLSQDCHRHKVSQNFVTLWFEDCVVLSRFLALCVIYLFACNVERQIELAASLLLLADSAAVTQWRSRIGSKLSVSRSLSTRRFKSPEMVSVFACPSLRPAFLLGRAINC